MNGFRVSNTISLKIDGKIRELPYGSFKERNNYVALLLTFIGPSAAPNITNLFNTSSTTLFVTWLHDIPPEMYNGILIGYQVRWQGSGASSSVLLGLDANSYNITGLNKYTSYNVFVAGRTNGGVGVERKKTVMTDEDSKKICFI